MRAMCSRQQQIFDSDLKGAWHYNQVTFTPIAKNFMLYCRLIYMLSILCVRLTIKVKVGIPESFKVGWYPPKKTGSSHLKTRRFGDDTSPLSNANERDYQTFFRTLKRMFKRSPRLVGSCWCFFRYQKLFLKFQVANKGQ